MSKKNKQPALPDTSLDFDACLGKKETEGRPGSLADFLGMSDVPETVEEAEREHNYQNWRKLWKGMPSYESQNLEASKQLIVNFRSEEDFLAFAEILGQPLTPKTKSVWHPIKEREENSLKRWIEDE